MINTSKNVGDNLIPDKMPNKEKKTVKDILNFQKESDGKRLRKRIVKLHRRKAKLIRRKSLTEGTEFKILNKNKIPLSKEERKKVMNKKAVWHHGPNGEESPAVWKTSDKSGKIWYVTNTHRAYQKRPTIEGAINIYHRFIKGTA